MQCPKCGAGSEAWASNGWRKFKCGYEVGIDKRVYALCKNEDPLHDIRKLIDKACEDNLKPDKES